MLGCRTRSFCSRTPVESSRARVIFFAHVWRIDEDTRCDESETTRNSHTYASCVKRAKNMCAPEARAMRRTRSRWNSLRDKNTWKSWSSPGAPAYYRGGLALESRGNRALHSALRAATHFNPLPPSHLYVSAHPHDRLAIPSLLAIGTVVISH